MSFLNNLDWRFATKQFDSEKKVKDQDLSLLLEAIKKAPTSFGLQPYHVHIVSNPELKKVFREAGYNQSQFQDASHILVFSTRVDLEKRVDEFVYQHTGGDADLQEKLADYFGMIRGFIGRFDQVSAKAWADRQTYIALGFALTACAELEIDSCPMEGFNSEDFDKAINLPENLKSVVALCIGYRKDQPQKGKFRFDDRDLFTFVD